MDKWQVKAQTELDKVIGYTKNGITRPWPMYNMAMDAWLWAYPLTPRLMPGREEL